MSRARGALVVLLGVALGGLGCDRVATKLSGGIGPEAGLLRGKLPTASRGATHLQRLTDGIAAEAGDPWRTDLTAILSPPEPFVTWDLGGDVPVSCVVLEGDGDDTYFVSLSTDGQSFAPLWTAGPDEELGQQLRGRRDLKGRGRYLRVAPAGGDGRWSLVEVSAWSDCPKELPTLAMQHGESLDAEATSKLWAFVALALLFVLGYRRRLPDWAKLLVVAPVGVGIAVVLQLVELWPLEGQLRRTVLVAVALLAVAVGLRVVLARRARPAATG